MRAARIVAYPVRVVRSGLESGPPGSWSMGDCDCSLRRRLTGPCCCDRRYDDTRRSDTWHIHSPRLGKSHDSWKDGLTLGRLRPRSVDCYVHCPGSREKARWGWERCPADVPRCGRQTAMPRERRCLGCCSSDATSWTRARGHADLWMSRRCSCGGLATCELVVP